MEKKKVFVIMPFEDEFFEVFEMLKMKFSDSFDFSNAGEEGNPQNILKDIIQPIYEADVIIADLTGLNPNVMYELGLAHAFNKKTITITQDEMSSLPFDLKQYRAKDYKTHFVKFEALVEYLRQNLNGAIDDSVSFGNPVKDFLELGKISDIDWYKPKMDNDDFEDGEAGFLDYLASIENNANEFIETISQMSSDMGDMCAGIKSCTSEIERVKKTGGDGTAAFVRKETKKAAKHVETFSGQLKNHSSNMDALWNKIEKSSLGLIESRFIDDESNKKEFITYLRSLYGIKEAAISSTGDVEDFKRSLDRVRGLERSMNQAISFLESDLESYIAFIDRMISSIDKILKKAQFVVGTIDFNCEEDRK